MKKLILVLLISLGMGPGAFAAGGGAPWETFPTNKLNDVAALQNGAKLFVNYCLGCHSASFLRYNRLRDIGLTEEQIKKNLMFTTEKVGDTMVTALDPKLAKEWFGGQPPDLTLVARSRADNAKGTGPDYLYTFLRSFYRDETKATGWDNTVFPSVGMPHVLWELQGKRKAEFVDEKDPHDASKTVHRFVGFKQLTPGTMTTAEYDDAMADLVAFMTWMSDPSQKQYLRLGVWVLLFLGIFTLIAWRLNAAYWKDVK
jgi:ubiquinol-cytochrome c reductase cytochrome c1 subunit